MKKIFLILAILNFFLYIQNSNSQIYQTWAKRYAGNGNDFVYTLKMNNSGDPIVSGNSYLSGWESPVVQYNRRCGETLWIDIIQNNGGEIKDIIFDNTNNSYVTGSIYFNWIIRNNLLNAKYNQAGTRIWMYNYGGNYDQRGQVIKLDASGYIYTGGYEDNNGYQKYAYAVRKFNNNGNWIWTSYYNNGISSYDHVLEDMILDPNGFIYVTGGSQGIGTDYDIATLKYDLNGNQLWVNRYSGFGAHSDAGFAIAQDGQGNVYVCGASTEQEIPTEDESQITFIVMKYNQSTGYRVWSRYFYGNGYPRNAKAKSIVIDGDDNIICTGYANMRNTGYDYIIIKYDPQGNLIWQRQYDYNNTSEVGEKVALDENNNVYVTGRSMSIPGEDYSKYDYATLKYSSEGNLEWSKRYNGPANNRDEAEYITVYGNNDICVSGKSKNQAGDYDFLTLRYFDGWNDCNEDNPPSGININNICFIDSNKMSAVDNNGSILKSNDHGLSWYEVINIGPYSMNAVKFFNNNLGIAAGNSGKIFISTNAGSNWFVKTSNIYNNLHDVCFTPNGNVFICGEKGLVIRASNYPGLFSYKNLDTNITIKSINFIDNNIGFATGSSGSLFKTTNNGNNWSRIQTNSNSNFNKIANTNKDILFLIGDRGVCLKSKNGGNSWQVLNIGVQVDLNDIFLKDSSNAYITGSNGTILYSSNIGYSWSKQKTGSLENLRSIKFNDNDIGIAAGDNSTFLKSSLGESTDYRPGEGPIVSSNPINKQENNQTYLNNNYPNPFNPVTNISYFLSEPSRVEIKIYDIRGRLISVLENKLKLSGTHKVIFDANGLASGVYFYQMNVFDRYGISLSFSKTKRMLFIK
ncbi:MAG: T9SS type A sorting domain-containing protein [Ignavibacteria bacterium]|nr:T9SS type A sorting domain-containing protein [Ignavibacteria bacterium]